MKHITEQIITSRLSQHERETHIFIEGDVAIMDSTIPRDFHKALKQNWEPISVTKYEDGTVCGMMLKAPRKAVSIRNANPVQRKISAEHKAKLAVALENYRKSIK